MVNGFGSLEGKKFIVGRSGHVLLDHPTVCNEHAELQFDNGRIRLRDLNSTNGLYLVVGEQRKRFREGYVMPEQSVYFGMPEASVKQLLDTIFSLTF
jgi:hypothetical protein